MIYYYESHIYQHSKNNCNLAASNTYLGLKIGWTFGASLFGAIFSFAILKPLSRALPPKWGGGYFGPQENCSAQSAATTAGGLSAGFVSGIPAMYKLGLMTTPSNDAVALLVCQNIICLYNQLEINMLDSSLLFLLLSTVCSLQFLFVVTLS